LLILEENNLKLMRS